MSEARLDQIVKGAPTLAQEDIPSIASTGVTTSPSDPLATLPSSPPQIYLNLLILEASLRAQYLSLQTRRHHHTFFLTLLSLWNLFFAHALFLRPREDGSGVGGSIYWAIESIEKVAFMAGLLTAVLVWGTGQWERGVRWPRRWVGVTNRGLRVVNLKIVLVKGSFWRETWRNFRFVLPHNWSALWRDESSGYRHVEASMLNELEKGTSNGTNNTKPLHAHTPSLPTLTEDTFSTPLPTILELDLAPGGDVLKLLLLPKPFSPTFRENWDTYRTTYWDAENERRRLLRLKLAEVDKARARQLRKEWWLSLFLFRWMGQSASSSAHNNHHNHHHHHPSHAAHHQPSHGPSGSFNGGGLSSLLRPHSSSIASSTTNPSSGYPNSSSNTSGSGAGGGGGGGGGGASNEKRTRSSSNRTSANTSSSSHSHSHSTSNANTHSRNSSRSSTPASFDETIASSTSGDYAQVQNPGFPKRRGSTASTSSVDSIRRPTSASVSGSGSASGGGVVKKKKMVQKLTPANASSTSNTSGGGGGGGGGTTAASLARRTSLIRGDSIGSVENGRSVGGSSVGGSDGEDSRPVTPAGVAAGGEGGERSEVGSGKATRGRGLRASGSSMSPARGRGG